MKQLTIQFIGGGNMAEAMVAGLLAAGHIAENISLVEVRSDRRDFLTEKYGVTAQTEPQGAANLLVLAVKPQQVTEAAAAVRHLIDGQTTVVSILAGVGCERLATLLGSQAAIVRVMPNTPALLGAGMSVFYTQANELHAARTEYLLGCCGEVARVDDEAQMHAVTALSGSGPAYFFMLAEELAKAGVELGLPEQLAEKLANQTAYGAGLMLANSGRPASALRQQVTSPGGTTQAALTTMASGNLPQIFRDGVAAAAKRSVELS